MAEKNEDAHTVRKVGNQENRPGLSRNQESSRGILRKIEFHTEEREEFGFNVYKLGLSNPEFQFALNLVVIF